MFVEYASQAHDLRSANLSVQLKGGQKRQGSPKLYFRRDQTWRRRRSRNGGQEMRQKAHILESS